MTIASDQTPFLQNYAFLHGILATIASDPNPCFSERCIFTLIQGPQFQKPSFLHGILATIASDRLRSMHFYIKSSRHRIFCFSEVCIFTRDPHDYSPTSNHRFSELCIFTRDPHDYSPSSRTISSELCIFTRNPNDYSL